MDTKTTLEQRGKMYGDFETHAKIAQQIKSILFEHNKEIASDPVLKEGLEMIAHKLARIANGNPYYIDTYRDIAGYAELIINYLKTHEEGIDVVVRYDNHGQLKVEV